MNFRNPKLEEIVPGLICQFTSLSSPGNPNDNLFWELHDISDFEALEEYEIKEMREMFADKELPMQFRILDVDNPF